MGEQNQIRVSEQCVVAYQARVLQTVKTNKPWTYSVHDQKYSQRISRTLLLLTIEIKSIHRLKLFSKTHNVIYKILTPFFMYKMLSDVCMQCPVSVNPHPVEFNLLTIDQHHIESYILHLKCDGNNFTFDFSSITFVTC